MLEGAKLMRYGAKAIPEGGLFAMPRPYADGLLLIGDSGGFLNGMRLKGIHLAIKSGMLAAETALDALAAGNSDAATLASFEDAFKESWAHAELRTARNFHQGFKGGLFAGMLNAGLAMYTGGRGFGFIDRLTGEAGYARMKKITETPPKAVNARAKIDNVLTFDKLTDVFNSGTMHEEDQAAAPARRRYRHLRGSLHGRIRQPVSVFLSRQSLRAAVRANRNERRREVDGRLQINFTNCVHCKTCDIMDPYQIITWVPPQGGEGPVYTGM